jgi:hypothetical protein
MLTETIKQIITLKAELKTKKKEMANILKGDKGYQAVLDDLKADKEVCKSYKDSLILASPDLQFRNTSIEASKSELKELYGALHAMVVPAIKAPNGQLSLFNDLEIKFSVV